jgi:nucleotide-binding universal stress UspA family protein
MNSIGKILVHFDDSVDSEQRLKLARQVAQMRANNGGAPSAVEAVYSTLPDYLAAYSAFSEFSSESIGVLLASDARRAQEARARFDQWIQAPGPGATWVSAVNEMPGNFLLSRSWLVDFLVLGQNNSNDASKSMLPRNLLADVILDSGKPCLIVPYIGASNSTLKNIMIAWKDTRESSRALVAAMPFLQNANSIHVVADVPPLKLQEFEVHFSSYLVANGISTKPIFRSNSGPDIGGNSLLSSAADVGADLLVMGCYGHSRVREFVLGGVTRTILQSMTLPVLMVH